MCYLVFSYTPCGMYYGNFLEYLVGGAMDLYKLIAATESSGDTVVSVYGMEEYYSEDELEFFADDESVPVDAVLLYSKVVH